MFLVNYSKDILFLVLAFSVLWLTFFLTWLIYYLVAAARQLHKASQVVKEQVDEVAGVIKKIKNALEMPTSIISLVFEGLKKIAELGVETVAQKMSGVKNEKKGGLNKEKSNQSKEESL